MAKRKHRTGNRPPRKGGKRARAQGIRGGARGAQTGDGGPYWLYGTHPAAAALANPDREILKAMVTPEALERLGAAADRLAGTGIPVDQAGRSDLDDLLPPGAVHQGIALQVRPLESDSLLPLKAAADDGAGSIVLALDQVTDPQNVGAILRSAAFYRVRALIMTGRHAPPESGALAKASAGALDMTPVIRVGNLSAALRELRDAGYWAVGLAGEAETGLADTPVDRPVVLVLGAEGDGLRRLTAETCDQLASLPRPTGPGDREPAADMDSLNVSNAAAVALALLAGRGIRQN